MNQIEFLLAGKENEEVETRAQKNWLNGQHAKIINEMVFILYIKKKKTLEHGNIVEYVNYIHGKS